MLLHLFWEKPGHRSIITLIQHYPALALFAKTYNPIGQFDQFDGSFLRLQSIELSYSLPKRWTRAITDKQSQTVCQWKKLISCGQKCLTTV